MARSTPRRTEGWQARPPTQPDPRRKGFHLGPVRVTPARVLFLVAIIASIAYVAFALTVRDTSQIPMLSSGAGILGVMFSLLTLTGGIAMWRAGVDRRSGTSFGMAILGGVSAMIALGCFAFAIVLALLWST